MPNRVIREGILTSERVNSLNWEAEVFYRRLLSVVDDYGRFDARPAVLRSALYPLKLDSMREDSVQRCLNSLEAARLIVLYSVEGKAFLEVTNFKQQVRSKCSKFPSPAQHMHSTCIADAQHMHTKTETESYTETKEHNSVPIRSTVVSGADGVRDGSLASSQQQVEQFPADADVVQRFMAGMVEVPGGVELERCAAGFYDDFAARGWRDSRGIPLADWRPAARKYARTWAVNNVQQTGCRGVMTGSRRKDANEGRRYA